MNRRIIVSLFLTVAVLTGAAILPAQEKPASKDTVSTMRASVGGSRRNLWRCNIKSPEGKGDSDELSEAIRRLGAVRFRKKSDLFAQSGDSSTEPESQPASQPASTTTQPDRISPETLAKLRKLPPGSIKDPGALADTLFLGGYPASAAFFYELALKNEMDADERAWLLLQVANCYRKSAPSLASKAYGKLLAEHPESPWSSAANMPRRIIEWRKVNKLDDLLVELRKRTERKSRPVPVIRETDK